MKLNREAIVLGFRNEVLLQEFVIYSYKQLGEMKINEIIQKVNSSKKVSKFLIEAKQLNAKLGTDDFLGCIQSSTSFVFATAETLSVATILLLIKWNHEIGNPQSISDDIYLNKTFHSILEKCDGYKTHINNTPNFFERFWNNLNETLLKIDNKSSSDDKGIDPNLIAF